MSAVSGLDGVVDFQNLRRTDFDPQIGKDRHQALAKRIELFLRGPDLADSDAVPISETGVELHAIRRPFEVLPFKSTDGFLVLLDRYRVRAEAGKDAHGTPVRLGAFHTTPRYRYRGIGGGGGDGPRLLGLRTAVVGLRGRPHAEINEFQG